MAPFLFRVLNIFVYEEVANNDKAYFESEMEKRM